VRVTAGYTEVLPEGRCHGHNTKSVVPKDKVFVPSRCYNEAEEPTTIIVACGDGNYQLKDLHWHNWGNSRTTASGHAWVNDCIPYCAAGTFHTYEAAVSLRKPRWCGADGKYEYRKMKVRSQGRTFRVKWSWTCGEEFKGGDPAAGALTTPDLERMASARR
jgi:hypothetical protein